MFLSAARYFKKTVIGSDKGISIILAIIIIIVLGLAGSIFAYLTSSGDITSRSNLTSAAAKYAAKSGVEITFYELENNGAFFNGLTPQGCPTIPVKPPGVNRTLTGGYYYLSGNLQGNLKTVAPGTNYTPTFCAVYGSLSGNKTNGCDPYVITSNGFAGGTEREVTAEAGKCKDGKGQCNGKCTGIYAETELPNG